MIVLPFPPSVNRLWRSVNGRTVLSSVGREYRISVCVSIWKGPRPRIGESDCDVSIRAFMPDARRRDLDNLLKATLDGLTAGEVWNDDSQIKRLTIEHCGIDRVNPRLEVEVKPL